MGVNAEIRKITVYFKESAKRKSYLCNHLHRLQLCRPRLHLQTRHGFASEAWTWPEDTVRLPRLPPPETCQLSAEGSERPSSLHLHLQGSKDAGDKMSVKSKREGLLQTSSISKRKRFLILLEQLF